MPKYVASRELLWSSNAHIQSETSWTRDIYTARQIVLPEGTRDSSFIVEFMAMHYWPGHTGYFSINTPEDFWCGFGAHVIEGPQQLVSGTVSDTGDMTAIRLQMLPPPSGCSYVRTWNFRIYGSKVYSGTCEPFLWVGDAFLTVGQILRDTGDRMGTVWFVGDVIQGWFNAAAGYFEGARDWFYSLGEWCTQIVSGLNLGDAWTWLLGLWGDFSGAVTTALGTTWTDLQDMYTNFYSWVIGVLGDPWTWLQGLYSDFSGAVTSILGDTWTWLLTLYGDFTGAVTGALGGTWTWLTEFINDPMSKLSLDMLDLVKSGFEWLTQEWFSFIDSTWDTFKGSFTWLMQKFFLLLDESWDTFEDSMKWLVGKTMDLVGDAAEDFATKIWEMIEKVVKKL